MVHCQKQEGLHQLGLNGWGADCDDGFMREDGCPLGHGPDIPGEAEPAQILQKLRRKQVPALEICNILGVKVQVLDIVDDLLQPRRNGKAAIIRALAEKIRRSSKYGPADRSGNTVAHGQLIKVAEHGQIQLFFGFHTGTSHGAS